MTPDALMKLLRALLSFAIGYASAKGYLTPTDANAITQFAIEVGPILIPAGLALYSNWNRKSVPTAAIAVDVGTQHNAAVGNSATVQTSNGTMAGTVVGALLLCLLFMPTNIARAADLPVLAKPVVPSVVACTTSGCSGWYVGANLMGIGSNADVVGNGINGSVFAAGGMVGLNAGYQLWNGTFFAAAELSADYDATGGIAAGGRPRYFASQLVKLGMGLQNLFSNQPTPSQGPVPINIPTSLSASLISPYFQVGAVERPWGTGWASGAGASFAVGGGWNLDLSYLFVRYNNAQVNPIQTEQSENLLKLSLNRMF